MTIVLTEFNLQAAERLLCVEALAAAGSIVEAAQLLGITRRDLKRRMIKHQIEWPRGCRPMSNPRGATLSVQQASGEL